MRQLLALLLLFAVTGCDFSYRHSNPYCAISSLTVECRYTNKTDAPIVPDRLFLVLENRYTGERSSPMNMSAGQIPAGLSRDITRNLHLNLDGLCGESLWDARRVCTLEEVPDPHFKAKP